MSTRSPLARKLGLGDAVVIGLGSMIGAGIFASFSPAGAAAAAVHPVHTVPHHAEIALAVIVSILVLTVDLRSALGFSSFGVLLYYVIANWAAFTQKGHHRRYPKLVQIVGTLGCLILVATLPPLSIGIGIAVFLVGIVGRLIVHSSSQRGTKLG